MSTFLVQRATPWWPTCKIGTEQDEKDEEENDEEENEENDNDDDDNEGEDWRNWMKKGTSCSRG